MNIYISCPESLLRLFVIHHPLVPPSSPPSQGNCFLSQYISLYFLEFYITGAIQCYSFCLEFFQGNFIKIIHIIVSVSSSFLFIAG